jgi:hypothetical protein
MQQPGVPFIPYSPGFYKQARHSSSAAELDALGTGFEEAWPKVQAEEIQDLRATLLDFANFTTFMDDFIEGRTMLAEPIQLTDFRNYCQHKLMSLPSQSSLTGDGQPEVDPLYEICRLACVAYSLLVIFPLAPTVGLFENLLLRMQSEITRMAAETARFKAPQWRLFFWTLTMGAIAGTGLAERQFFLFELRRCLDSLNISGWREALNTLVQFLWHPSTNNKDGLTLWSDLQSLQAGTQAVMVG